MKITKSNNIGFDLLEYETILTALEHYRHGIKCNLDLIRHKLSKQQIEHYERELERAKKLHDEIYESEIRYTANLTNW